MLLAFAIVAAAFAVVAYSANLRLRRRTPEQRRIQRRYTRIPMSLPVDISPSEGTLVSSIAQNISVDGMLLTKAASALRVAEPVQLSFVLPRDPAHLAFVLPQDLPVDIPAVVWRHQGHDAVVRFDPTHPQRKTIQHWVAHAERSLKQSEAETFSTGV